MTAGGSLNDIRIPVCPEEELRFGLKDQLGRSCVEIRSCRLECAGERQKALGVAIPLTAWPEFMNAVLRLDDILALEGLVDVDDDSVTAATPSDGARSEAL